MAGIKKPAVAGQFYSKDPEELRSEVRAHIDKAEIPPPDKRVVAMMVPHAAHFYSGAAAGHGYCLVEGQPIDTVVLFGLSHRVPCRASILEAERYQTPLGMAVVDTDLVASIRERLPWLTYQAQPHAQEHSVEVQIPFIQVALPDAKIVEILLQADDPETCAELGHAVAAAIQATPEKRVLVVGSSDMSHFQSGENARRVDSKTLNTLKTLNLEEIRSDIELTESSFSGHDCALCAKGAVYAALETAKALGATSADVVAYRNSGDVVPMHETGGRVVGYGVLAIYSEEDAESQLSGPSETLLNEEQQRELLRAARRSIASGLRNEPLPLLGDEAFLKFERGLFVSLHCAGRLRGCLGRFEAGGAPLGELVPVMAREAAAHDPRFSPVQEMELAGIDLEVSVLTPMRRIEDPGQVEPGRHGLYITGYDRFGRQRSGTLLPQVAAEHGWDRETFLQQTCNKAGLDLDVWRDSRTELFVYEAQVFGEKTLGLWPPQ